MVDPDGISPAVELSLDPSYGCGEISHYSINDLTYGVEEELPSTVHELYVLEEEESDENDRDREGSRLEPPTNLTMRCIPTLDSEDSGTGKSGIVGESFLEMQPLPSSRKHGRGNAVDR